MISHPLKFADVIYFLFMLINKKIYNEFLTYHYKFFIFVFFYCEHQILHYSISETLLHFWRSKHIWPLESVNQPLWSLVIVFIKIKFAMSLFSYRWDTYKQIFFIIYWLLFLAHKNPLSSQKRKFPNFQWDKRLFGPVFTNFSSVRLRC